MTKYVTIQIPESIDGMKCDTNGIHPVVIMNALNLLQKHFAKELVKFLDRLTKKYLSGGGGDFKIDDVNRFN